MIRLLNKEELEIVNGVVTEIMESTSSLIEARLASDVGEKRAKETMLRVDALVERGLTEEQILSELQGDLGVNALFPAIAVAALAATQTSCVGILKDVRER